MEEFGPDALLARYRKGVFPMAESRYSRDVFLMNPDLRGVIPLDRFHVPRRLKRTVRNTPWRVICDTDFQSVIKACAAPSPNRSGTWINDWIIELYETLHARGHAHSIEVYDGEALLGGLYGVSLGGAFFGESMFSRARDASKIALVHLVARLRLGGYALLDAQFHNQHLVQFGLEEIPSELFHRELEAALALKADFYRASSAGGGLSGLEAISHSSGQTS